VSLIGGLILIVGIVLILSALGTIDYDPTEPDQFGRGLVVFLIGLFVMVAGAVIGIANWMRSRASN